MRADIKQTLTRGFFGKCPECGEGKMLKKYTTPNESCANCNLDFAPLRADDGPAWATILITGHLTMPFTFLLFDIGMESVLLIIALSILFICGLSLLILPRAKGMFMAMIWNISGKEEDPKPTPEQT